MNRPFAALVSLLFVALLFAPAAAAPDAAGAHPGDAGLAAGGAGGDAPTLGAIRPAVVASGLSRADTEGVLDQSTRSAVYGAIEDAPGRTLADVATTVGVAKSTVRYHVGVLRDAGLVDVAEVGGTLRLAPAEADAELAAALRAEATRPLLEAVAGHEPASVTTVAASVDRAPSTVSHHLSALADRGIVERERAGEAVLTRLPPEVRGAVEATSGD